MAKSETNSKLNALKMASNMGCSGAHKDKDGNWMPCSSHEEMQRISNAAEGDNWRSVVPGYKGEDGRVRGRRKRRRNDQWEELGSRGVISIDSLQGGGIVSGQVVVSKTINPCWDGYVMEGMKKGKNGKLVPNCVPIKKKSFQGPEFVRDNDPDVFTDIESARLRSRQLGCIGVSRRVSKTGRTVWMPCTNISDYSRLAGTTSLGRRGKKRDFERAVRTVLMSELKRPKRKVSIYEELYKKS